MATRCRNSLDQQAGEAWKVANHAVLFKQIVASRRTFISQHAGCRPRRLRAFHPVTPRHFGRDLLAVGDHVIDDALAHMVFNRAQVLAERVMRGLAGRVIRFVM